MEQEDEVFREALIGKKIPILTLDNQWHRLFTQTGENEEIQRLEDNLNEILKRQGKLNTELKSLSAFKKKLMQEIVSIMELPDSSAKEKKMAENKCKIEDANQRMDAYSDELMEIPKQIDEANFALMRRKQHEKKVFSAVPGLFRGHGLYIRMRRGKRPGPEGGPDSGG